MNRPITNRPVTAIIVGAGHRSLGMAAYSHSHPDLLKIVGVADPNPLRRKMAAERHDLPPERCYDTAEELAKEPRFADAAINGTMDAQHVPTTLPLLEAGYDVLLEKPIATSRDDLLALHAAAVKHGRTVMVCHVLRYAPFYYQIRKRVSDGEIGRIVSIHTAEHVSYHHMDVGYVRGKWNRKDTCGSSMLMAKCCHDMDIIAWMKSGIPPRLVASMGSLMQFRAENAPEGSGTRCLVDCPIEPDCLYSARKIYLDHGDRWYWYVWDKLHDEGQMASVEAKIESLKTGPYGRCVWKCDNDVVDHQSVVVQFADGSTATHDMVGGAARPARYIHIVGTLGEIQGDMEQGTFTVRKIDPRPGHEYSEELVDVKVSGDGHGGGDARLLEDFLHVLRGESTSLSTTFLEDSIYGHLIGFAADKSREECTMVEIEPLSQSVEGRPGLCARHALDGEAR